MEFATLFRQKLELPYLLPLSAESIPEDVIKWTWEAERFIANYPSSSLTTLAKEHTSRMRSRAERYTREYGTFPAIGTIRRQTYQNEEEYFADIEAIKIELMNVLSDLEKNDIKRHQDIKNKSLMQNKNSKFVSRLTYTKRTFRYRGKDHPIKGEPDYAFLCDVFYARCPKSDNKLRWEEVYHAMPPAYRGEPYKGMEKMRGTIKTLNRWAENNIEGIPELLRLEKGQIIRLK